MFHWVKCYCLTFIFPTMMGEKISRIDLSGLCVKVRDLLIYDIWEQVAVI